MTIGSKRVFETPWFSVVEAPQSSGAPYYMLTLPDYVTVIALTSARDVLLVRLASPAEGLSRRWVTPPGRRPTGACR